MICEFKYIVGFFIYHGCDASKGSSGSPIVKEVNGNLRVVAIHRSGVAVTSNLHYGTAFKAVLCHANLIRGQGNWLQILQLANKELNYERL